MSVSTSPMGPEFTIGYCRVTDTYQIKQRGKGTVPGLHNLKSRADAETTLAQIYDGALQAAIRDRKNNIAERDFR